MLRFVIALSMIYPAGYALAQSHELSLPKRSGTTPTETVQQAAPGDDIILLYKNRRAAGLVAFRVGYEVAKRRETERSIDLFLEALKREPSLVKALYNLGVECSIAGRWKDARQFYQTYSQQPNVAGKIAEAEIQRVAAVSSLEDGRVDYLKQLVTLVDEKNAELAIVKLEGLSRKFSKNWEAPALRGEDFARVGRYQESIEQLREAARRARPDMATRLNAAAELAQKELNFATQVNNADQARQSAQYENAAKLYTAAWNLNRAHADLIMNAATSQLMVDKVDDAVGSLEKARDAADPNISDKAIKMLKELGAINPDAAALASARPTSAGPEAGKTTAELIAEQIGPLKTPEIMLALQPPPELLEEKTDVLPVPNDLKAYGEGKVPEFKSTDSIFEIYQRNIREAESRQQAPLADASPPPAAASDVAVSAPEPPPPPVQPAAAAVRASSGPLQTVSVKSFPSGATVHIDENEQDSQQCQSPCTLSLALGSRHTLLLTLSGYREERRIIDKVERGGRSMDIKLEEASGLISLPAYAGIVRIDGKQQQTPNLVRRSAGQHEISFELNGQITTQKVMVEDQKTTEIRLGQQN